MSVKVCGHEVRFEKPIKVYTFFKSLALLAVLSVVFVAPSYSAENDRYIQVASTDGADPCSYTKVSRMDQRGIVMHETPVQNQRTAGTSLSPAMALALALGYRNVAGPMERTAPPRVVREE